MNPWSLPLEERPPLFDPCAEIPIEVIEEGVGSPVEVAEELTRHQPGDLMTCSWGNRESHVSVLATWKSREDYLADPAFSVIDSSYELGSRTSLRLREASDLSERACYDLFFTEAGTVWISFSLETSLREFNGNYLSNSCDILGQVVEPIESSLPSGDF